jgi:hypothetical protein
MDADTLPPRAPVAALWRWRSAVIPVILACGAAGLAHHLIAAAG